MAALAIIYFALLAFRAGIALRYSARRVAAGAASPGVAILQPVLSGDPALESMLARNARALPDAHFYWLVDEDDPAGQAAARRAAAANTTIVVGPGPGPGENPKTAKLARVLDRVEEPVTVVLDDDTVLDREGLQGLQNALEHANLVCGMPFFCAQNTIYERFLGGFVNGNATLTYLPAAALGIQHTINGMIYAVRTTELRELGGFAAIQSQLTDDYAMARLYERQNRRILQTAVYAGVSVTIREAAHCGRLLRRWLLFANRYVGENASPGVLILVAAPAVLPLAGFLAGLGWWWAGCLFAKAVVNRVLLWRISGRGFSPVDLCFEVVADILLPLFYVSALVRPGEMRWRSRRISMDGERIRYRQ